MGLQYRTWGGLSGALIRKLERAIMKRFGMPPIVLVRPKGHGEIEFVFSDDSRVRYAFKIDADEEHYDVWLEWDFFKSNGARGDSGTIPIIKGPRQFPRWMSTAVAELKPIVRMVTASYAREAYSYSCLLARFPEPVKSKMIALSEAIPDEFIEDGDDDGELGREDKPHVTVKFGLHTTDPEEVMRVLGSWEPIKVKLGKSSAFNNDKHIVLKMEVSGSDLMALNKHVCSGLENTDTFPVYKPHATIAYLKKNEDDPEYYKKFYDNSLEGTEMIIDELEFATPEGEKTVVALTGNQNQKVARKLVDVACRLIAASDNAMGAWGGEEYRWPEPRGWQIVDWNKTDVFGDSMVVSYQHYDSANIIDFDGEPFVRSDGKKPGTYKGQAYGEKISGTWRNLKELSAVFDKIAADILSARSKWSSKLPKVPGWKSDNDDQMTGYTFEKTRPEELLMVTFEPDGGNMMADVVLGDEVCEVEVYYSAESDYAGRHGQKKKRTRVKGASGIKKALREAEKLYAKWTKDYYGE